MAKALKKKLTKAEEKLLEEYFQKYLKIGTCTEPADRKAFEVAVTGILTGLNLEVPPFVWVASPKAAQVVLTGLDELSKLPEHPDKGTPQDLMKELGLSKLQQYPNPYYGQMDVHWIATYKFGAEIGVEFDPKDLAELELWDSLAKSGGWWWPFDVGVVCTERPSEIHMDDNGNLHMDGGPAVKYRDGWSIWRLHGVRVDQWLAEDAAESIDPARLTEIENVQVRMEFVRKVGINRIAEALNAEVIDKDGDYELILLDLKDGRKRPYLKMRNATDSEIWHIEGVTPDCSTVQQAIVERCSLQGVELADDGEEWYQQGDVIIKPLGATKLKKRPTILT